MVYVEAGGATDAGVDGVGTAFVIVGADWTAGAGIGAVGAAGAGVGAIGDVGVGAKASYS